MSIAIRQVSTSDKTVSFKSLNQEKFDRIFPVFLTESDEKDKMVTKMNPVFETLRSHRWWTNKKTIKVLDVGCGDGFATAKIFKMVQSFFPGLKLKINALDNNQTLLDIYKQSFPYAKVSTQQTDAFTGQILDKNADFAIASHSLYHAKPEKLGTIIPAFYKALNPNGVGVISLLKDTSDFTTIQREFAKYVTSQGETNSVSVKMKDIEQTIRKNPLLHKNSISIPYKSFVYFPEIPGGFKSFKDWQLKNYAQPAPNSQCQKTLDLLEFIIHGDFDKLRKANKLEPFLQSVEKMFEKNGKDAKGRLRINFDGKNIFFLGAELIATMRDFRFLKPHLPLK